MDDILFLIIALCILSLITTLKILIAVWGKKYRYKSTWDMLEFEDSRTSEEIKKKKYGQ
ncbi:hypothetical protein [Metabacillus sediminilitoris]|uniref:hypothetical protein n=1 Tax=Metabacillus sediminilitoris TaxID=2567941 RepID=UPI0012D7FF74|nr:hypothetical protein [Metabacillus sediminilitoris]QGQ48074.1 hypothetical protein GMB29_24120 [Metabacillus sediminilitoris]